MTLAAVLSGMPDDVLEYIKPLLNPEPSVCPDADYSTRCVSKVYLSARRYILSKHVLM